MLSMERRRHDPDSFGDYALWAIPMVFAALRGERSRRFHGGGKACHTVDSACADCNSISSETALVLFTEFRRVKPASSAPEFVRSRAVSRSRDVADKSAHVELGHLTRIARRVDESAWIRSVTSELDRVLLKDLLWFAMGQDLPEPGRIWPVERLSAKHDMPCGLMDEWIRDLLDRLVAARPAWVEHNIERPLSQRLGMHIAGGGDISEQPDIIPTSTSVEEHVVSNLWSRAVCLAQQGTPADEALEEACLLVLGVSEARALRADAAWPGLVATLTEFACGG